jgi:hypothetical protein
MLALVGSNNNQVMSRRKFFLIILSVLIFVVGTLFVPSLLYRYRGIREGTAEDAERLEEMRKK